MKSHSRICLVAFITATLFMASLSSSTQPSARAQRISDQSIIARVTITNEQDLKRFVTLGLDLLEIRKGDDLLIMTTQAQFDELRRAGWRITVDDEQTNTLRQQSAELGTGSVSNPKLKTSY